MHRWLLDFLICPDCSGENPLTVNSGNWEGERLEDGVLACAGCGGTWPVRNSVPRFVPEEKDYAGGFGFQWQRWRLTQIDRLNGTTLTTDRLLTDTDGIATGSPAG